MLGSTKKFNAVGNPMALVGDTLNYETVFYGFFYNAKIVDASGLTLNATTLANNCYTKMFYGCSSLVTAPALPATTLANNCYTQMFYGCTSLTEVTVLANSYTQGYFVNWLNNVAASGTIHKKSTLSLPSGSANGIPTGWTAIDDQDAT